LTLIAAILGGYVCGAVWDDREKRKFIRDMDDGDFYHPEPYAPPSRPFTADDTGPN